jgi:hypothetical protein
MLGTFVAYWPAMRNSFVWDDTALVLRDPLIRSWRLAPDAFREFLFLDATASNFYRPLQRLTFAADYAFWGIARPADAPTAGRTGAPETGDSADISAIQRAPQPGWHFTSVFFHALAAVALCWLLRVWLGSGGEWWALAGSLAWALHPLHTSAVTYVSGRADSLAAVFVFCGLALVAQACASGLIPGDRTATRRAIGAALCALAALLSKESGVVLLLLWLVWVTARARRDRRAWMAWLAAVAVVCGTYLTLRCAADRTPPPAPSETAPWPVRPILAARALAEYAALFVAPHSLHMERDVSTKPTGDEVTTLRWARLREAQTLAGCLLAVGLVWWWRWARRRAPDAALALTCFVVTWAPISNLFRLNATVAEHWLYVPGAFLIGAVLFTSRTLGVAGTGISPGALRAAAAMWVLFLAVQTWRQQEYWRDQGTFVTETISRAGRGARMVINLGQLAAQEGRTEDALVLFREALVLEPKLALAHFNIAALAFRKKDYDTALAELAAVEGAPLFESEATLLRARIEQARTGEPRFDMLGRVCMASGRMWSNARQFPLTLAAAGRLDGAYEELTRQVTERHYRAEAWRLLGQIAEQVGRLPVAAQAYGKAANRDVRDTASRERLKVLRAGL